MECFYCQQPIEMLNQEVWAMPRDGDVLAVKAKRKGRTVELMAHRECFERREKPDSLSLEAMRLVNAL